MKLLGIDYGEGRVGLAVTGDEGTFAMPRETLQNKGRAKLVERIAGVIKEDAIEKVIVGLPISLTGDEGKIAQDVRDFAATLGEASGVPVDFEDERFSSAMAESLRREIGERHPGTDADAAALILQSYIDRNA